MKICVLLGGASPERHVSLESGLAMGKAVQDLGHDCIYADPATPLCQREEFLKTLENFSQKDVPDFEELNALRDETFLEYISFFKKEKPDLIVNGLHGGHGEDGMISGILDMLEIPYTGSGMTASAVAMDKQLTKIVSNFVGVKTAKGVLISEAVSECQGISFPCVVKPNDSGSSVGLHILRETCDLQDMTADALKYSKYAIVEEYITGREFDVPVLMGKAFPVVEVNPHGDNDYRAKYLGIKTDYFVPARLSAEETEKMQNCAEKVYHALGLKNYARVDFRMKENGEIYLLEANTLPGMTLSSLVPKSAKANGLSFNDLVERIINNAIEYHTKKD